MRPQILLAIALLLTAALLAGCGSHVASGGPLMGGEMDFAERAPGSLAVDVLDYNWAYVNNGAHIRIMGRALNSSGEPLQAVVLNAALYDDRGRLLAQGSSYITPTYLKPGAMGEFEFITAARREGRVARTRLETNCRTGLAQ